MLLRDAILFAKQRMRENGKTKDQYHYEHIFVIPTAVEIASGYFERPAYTELWYLLNPEKYFGLLILADNSAYNTDNALHRGVNEFTGMIRFIKIAADWNLSSDGGGGLIISPEPCQFLRVTIY